MEALLSLETEKLKYARFFIDLENKKENINSSRDNTETLEKRLQSQKSIVIKAGGISADKKLDIFIEMFGNTKLQEKVISATLDEKFDGKTNFSLNSTGINESHLILIASSDVLNDAIEDINKIIDCSRYINTNETSILEKSQLMGLNSKDECLSFINEFMIRNNEEHHSNNVVSIGL